jgi:DNA recombination protein RmuC
MKYIVTIGQLGLDSIHLGLFGALFLLAALYLYRRGQLVNEVRDAENAQKLAAFEITHLTEDRDEVVQQLRTQRAVTDDFREKLAAAEARRSEDEQRFAEMAQSVMRRATGQFMEIANATFEKHKEGARGDLERLMEPIGKTFKDFRERVDLIEKVRTEDRSTLQEQIKAIGEGLARTNATTGKLVTALSAPRGGGSWGEESLRNVLELSGMSGYADFLEQNNDQTERGRLRPDVIIRMPGGREMVIDAKVSVEDFIEAAGTSDAAARKLHLEAHARKLRDHVKRLAAKEYWRDFEDRVDFVAMYVPGEQFYAGAMEVDRDLFDYAARNKVLIVTPSTLIALAKAVAYGWRQEESARNAREAADLGRQLYDSIAAMGGHVEKLGKAMHGSVNAYNSFVGSLEANVLPKARKFEALQIAQAGAKPVATLDGVTEPLRLPDRNRDLRFDEDDATEAAE